MSKPAAEVSTYLFVYGTLMTRTRGTLGAEMRARLQAIATSLGPATTAGRLVDLGAYPGLVEAATADDVVHGEVFRLDDAAGIFAWLDDYEGISAETAADHDYERILAPVRLASGADSSAWLYRYRGTASNVPSVAGGKWLG